MADIHAEITLRVTLDPRYDATEVASLIASRTALLEGVTGVDEFDAVERGEVADGGAERVKPGQVWKSDG